MVDALSLLGMNLWGSSGGGGATHEVEPDRCLLAGIDFRGAIMVDLGLGFGKHKKWEKEQRGQPKFVLGGNEEPVWLFKRIKIFARYIAT